MVTFRSPELRRISTEGVQIYAKHFVINVSDTVHVPQFSPQPFGYESHKAKHRSWQILAKTHLTPFW